MGTTTNHAFRYPEDANGVAVPADIKKLADDLDAKVISSAGGTVSGNVSFTGTTVVQTPTANNHAATKLYVDTADTAITTELGANPSGTFSTVVQRLDSYTDGFTKIGNLLTSNQALVADTSGVASGTNYPTIARVADANAYGGYAIEATAASTGLFTISWSSPLDISHSSSTVTPGQQITVHFSIRNSVGTRSTRAYIAWMNSGKTLLSESFSQYVTGGAFTTVVLTAIVPTNAAYLNLLIYSNTGAVGDKVLIERPGIWFGASSVWQPPGTPIVGQSHIAINNAVHLSGTGSPESVISAAPGSTYLQTDSVVDVKGWIRWIKSTGTGNTGWIAGPEADTGVRNIVSSLINGWVQAYAVPLQIVRVGSFVYIRGYLNATNATNDKFLDHTSIPSGFKPYQQLSANAIQYNSTTYYALQIASDYGMGILGATATKPTTIMFSTVWHTRDSWPTSLPGTAA